MNTKRDKFLTEAMGECWHDYVKTCGCCPATCAKCGADEGYTENNDFSTWHDFGKLWAWAQQQEWWCDFSVRLICFSGLGKYIHPDRFANAIYAYLKHKENP